jgi:hypothetical protein
MKNRLIDAFRRLRFDTATGVTAAAIIVFLIALAVRLIAAAGTPILSDEPWHLLAAHSWTQEGTFRVFEGTYTRTGYFTIVVSWFMRAFGETLAVARLPSIIAGATLVAAVFIWLKREGGTVAAWTFAALFCFDRLSIDASAEVRFYGPQALFFWMGAAAIYRMTALGRDMHQRLWMLLAAGVFLAIALYLQVTTAVGILALGFWAATDLTYRFSLLSLLKARWVQIALAIAVPAAILLAIVAHVPTHLADGYDDFRSVRIWNLERQNLPLFYHRYFLVNIPLLWGLFPLALMIALTNRTRAAVFCGFLSIAPIAIMSFGGMKADRYIFFAMPYLFAIWGLTIETVFPAVLRWAHTAWDRAIWFQAPGPNCASRIAQLRIGRYGLVCGSIVVLSFAILSQNSFIEATRILTKGATVLLSRPARFFVGPAIEPWASHRDELVDLVHHASVFVTSGASLTLLNLGPYDVVLNRNAVDETPAGQEFAVDPRTGRPTIGTVDSLQKIMDCYPDGVVLVVSNDWRRPAAVDDATANFLVSSAQLTLLKARGSPDELLVFRWQGRENLTSAQCTDIRSLLARHQPSSPQTPPP